MNGPQVLVQYDQQGASELLAVNQRLVTQMGSLEQALRDTMHAANDAAVAEKKVGDAGEQAGGMTAKLGAGMVVAANQAVELAQKALGAAKGLAEFAKKGGEAIRIAKGFSGDIEKLRASSLNMIDDTTLQSFDKLGEKIGVTSEQVEHITALAAKLYADGFGESAAANVEAILAGEAEQMRKLGLSIDEAALAAGNFSESQKKTAIALQQAAKGANVNLDAIDQSALGLDQAGTQLDNFVSDLQVAAFEFLNSSGLLDMLSTALAEAKTWFAENKDTVEELFSALGPTVGVFGLVGPIVKIATAALKIVTPVVKHLADIMEGARAAVAFFLDPLADLADALTGGIPSGEKMADTVKRVAAEAAEGAPKIDATTEAVAGLSAAVAALAQAPTLTETVNSATEMRRIINAAGDDVDLLADSFLNLAASPKEAVDTLVAKEYELQQALQERRRTLDTVEDRHLMALRAISNAQDVATDGSGRYSEALQQQARMDLPRMREELARLNVELEKERTAYDWLSTAVDNVSKALGAVDGAVDNANKKARKQTHVIRDLASAWSELQGTIEGVHMALSGVTEAAGDKVLESLSSSFGAANQESIAGQFSGQFSAITGAAALGAGAGADQVQDGEFLQQGALSDTIALGDEAHLDALKSWRSEIETSGDAFSSFVSQFSQDADNLGSNVIRITGALQGLVGDVVGTFEAVQAAGTNSGKAWEAGIHGGIQAAGMFTAALVQDQQAQAAILGAMEVAHAASAIAFGNYFGAAAHGVAAIQYFAVAGGGAGKPSSAGGGAAKSKDAVEQRQKRDATLLSRDPNDRGPITPGVYQSITVNLQSFDRRSGASTITDILNESARLGTGNQLDRRLLGVG